MISYPRASARIGDFKKGVIVRQDPKTIDLGYEPGGLLEVPDQPGHWILHMGPQHPATHTTIHLVLELDGERIVKAVPHIGYLHSGFEKLGEYHTFDQYVTVCDRMNYVSPMANDLAWHHTIEKLMGIEITPRCKYIRTIIAEMARIQDHCLSVGELALEMGAFTAFLYLFNEREFLMDCLEHLCGARFTNSWTRIGGAMSDISAGWVERMRKFCGHFPQVLAETHKLLTRNRIFWERSKNVAVMGQEDASNWGWTGPIARASGITRDLRKDEPYLAYGELDFDVAVATGGDVLARYLVRMEEMSQAVRIISSALENIPPGSINVDRELKTILPDKAEVYGSIEGLITHFEILMPNRLPITPVAEVYGAQETANGELGFYLVSQGVARAWRVKVRSPSLIHLQAAGHLLRGHTISEVVVALSSLNIIAAELDR